MQENRPIENSGSELVVRREKLAALQAAGNDPFQLTKYDVTALSTEILADFDAYEGKTIDVKGIVDYFSGDYQIKVFSASDIIVK